jgi:hypothetical protein
MQFGGRSQIVTQPAPLQMLGSWIRNALISQQQTGIAEQQLLPATAPSSTRQSRSTKSFLLPIHPEQCAASCTSLVSFSFFRHLSAADTGVPPRFPSLAAGLLSISGLALDLQAFIQIHLGLPPFRTRKRTCKEK